MSNGLHYHYDSEFVDNGRTLELISLALVCEDGRELYMVNREMNLADADDFVMQTVIPRLEMHPALWRSKNQIRDEVEKFLGIDRLEPLSIRRLAPEHHAVRAGQPKIWAWYGSHDWVILGQLWGPFSKHPPLLPHRVRDFKQYVEDLKLERKDSWVKKPENAHNALADARWLRDYYNKVMAASVKEEA